MAWKPNALPGCCLTACFARWLTGELVTREQEKASVRASTAAPAFLLSREYEDDDDDLYGGNGTDDGCRLGNAFGVDHDWVG